MPPRMKGTRHMKPKTKFIVIVVLALSLLVGGFMWVSTWNYSEGSRSGIVVKFSHKGFLKTWEGQLNMGIVGADAQFWDFSVQAPEVIKKVQEAQDIGGRVKLVYEEKFWTIPWRGQTPYLITDVIESKGK